MPLKLGVYLDETKLKNHNAQDFVIRLQNQLIWLIYLCLKRIYERVHKIYWQISEEFEFADHFRQKDLSAVIVGVGVIFEKLAVLGELHGYLPVVFVAQFGHIVVVSGDDGRCPFASVDQ